MLLENTDFALISEAIYEGGNIWENRILDPVKRKIKNYFRIILHENCCYCRRDTSDEFNMVLDIEHILPKAIFPFYMFSPFNLSVSCKRCNMEIKKNDISFLIDQNITELLAGNKDNYQFIHPNFDIYSDHLTKEMYQYEDKKLIKYVIIEGSSKGKYTKTYFQLERFEQNSFDDAQGAAEEPKFSDLISKDIVDEIQNLLK